MNGLRIGRSQNCNTRLKGKEKRKMADAHQRCSVSDVIWDWFRCVGGLQYVLRRLPRSFLKDRGNVLNKLFRGILGSSEPMEFSCLDGSTKS